MFDGYDGAWSIERDSSVERGSGRFHRTGDVGYLSGGVLFQLGRAVHVIRTAHGPVASISVEEPIADTLGRSVAALGIGPAGTQVLAVVVEDDAVLALASSALAAQVRAASVLPLAAVLTGRLPTDRRHESKVDRSSLATSVNDFLAGR
jgi:acyl-CoA synthetase (AMP-forming)/AMP-acid ligase II